jgi:hypothetical protein
MRLPPQTSGVNRRTRSKLDRAGIAPIGVVGPSIFPETLTRTRVGRTATGCQVTCELDFGYCDLLCHEIYWDDDPGYIDCRHGCTIGYDICLATCELRDGPF